ncbi:MAG TPA: MarR family winged helix-turn-helix transcriptional regulator [Polyangiales bacterium]|nr:MarR family winged helix-turn-helix transcriptional regulator [Polyangiales bacterium]
MQGEMAKIDPTRLWSLNYRLVSSVITDVGVQIAELDLEVKELFLLAAMEQYPYPAELASELCIPKPSVTAYLKRLEAAGFVRREIDAADLRRHRLALTASGRKVMTQGMELLAHSFGTRLTKLSAAEQNELRRLFEKMESA